jgi:hypothetical protein
MVRMMVLKRTRPLPLLVLAGTLATGCDILGSGDERFVVRVDSISAPAAVDAGTALEVQFHGWVGPNGCSSLSRVEKRAAPQLLEIRFHGVRRSGDCTQMPVPLEHTERAAPPLSDPFTIRVLQPDGASLERVVRVGSDGL